MIILLVAVIIVLSFLLGLRYGKEKGFVAACDCISKIEINAEVLAQALAMETEKNNGKTSEIFESSESAKASQNADTTRASGRVSP